MAVHARPAVVVPPPNMHHHGGGSATFAAHRCVLTVRSPVFRAAFCGPMKESAGSAAAAATETTSRLAGMATPPAVVVVVVPPPKMHEHISALLLSKDCADVTLELDGGATFVAHRCVLAARSPVFRAAFCGLMKESAGGSAVVRVEEMAPEVFGALLGFIYTDSLPAMAMEGQDEMAMLQHLLAAADRYDLTRLKLICGDKLIRRMDVTNVMATLPLAKRHHFHELKRVCTQFFMSPGILETWTPDRFQEFEARDGM